MKVLVVGVGLQGKAVVHDLEQSDLVTEIITTNTNTDAIKQYVKERGYKKVRCEKYDMSDLEGLVPFIKGTEADIVVSMVPPFMAYDLANACIEAKVDFVSSNYTGKLTELADKAKANNVALFPEMGLDPGIDLVLGRLAVDYLDTVEGFYSYGSGVPAPESNNNLLSYKISWTLAGVFSAARREGLIIKDSKEEKVAGEDLFKFENCHQIEFGEFGTMEAYVNGDAPKYVKILGLDDNLKDMGRYALRWPGHCAKWGLLSQLGLFNDEPLKLENGGEVSPKQFMVEHLTPQLEYADNEKDLALLRIDAWGKKDGKPCRILYDLVDYRDMETGFFAMNRTVGYVSSIAALFILSGKVTKKGLLSPVNDVPTEIFLEELKKRNMKVTKQVIEGETGRPGTPVAITF